MRQRPDITAGKIDNDRRHIRSVCRVGFSTKVTAIDHIETEHPAISTAEYDLGACVYETGAAKRRHRWLMLRELMNVIFGSSLMKIMVSSPSPDVQATGNSVSDDLPLWLTKFTYEKAVQRISTLGLSTLSTRYICRRARSSS